MNQAKQALVGLGPIFNADWKPRLFRCAQSVKTFMDRTMPADLKRHGFRTIVAEFPDYFRASYAAMPVNLFTGKAGVK